MSSDAALTSSVAGSSANWLELYAQMYTIRQFELRVQELVRGDPKVSRYCLLSVGQEATAVGVCAALRKEDRLALSYRSHAAFLARGADLGRLLAEILGRSAGYCGGRAGSVYVVAPELGIIDTAAIVGGQIPVATGSALSAWVGSEPIVTACFFGDGAVSEGAFHESLNMAALWALPIVYVCENNRVATRRHFDSYSPVRSVAQRATAYGIPAVQVDGNDVIAVQQAAEQAVNRARDDGGPSLIDRSYAVGLSPLSLTG